MTRDEMINKLRVLLDDDKDTSSETLSVYLEMAGYKILEKCYPFASGSAARYQRIQLELARNAYMQVGLDNQTELTDNGVKRVFKSDDELLSHVYPCAHVPTTAYVESS